jgi:hypothetical protein
VITLAAAVLRSHEPHGAAQQQAGDYLFRFYFQPVRNFCNRTVPVWWPVRQIGNVFNGQQNGIEIAVILK